MRSTLILEDKTMIYLKGKAADQGKTLTEVVNETLSIGIGRMSPDRKPWICESFTMGGGFDYADAWKKIDELEAGAVAEKMELRK